MQFASTSCFQCLLVTWMVLTVVISVKYILVVLTHDWSSLEVVSTDQQLQMGKDPVICCIGRSIMSAASFISFQNINVSTIQDWISIGYLFFTTIVFSIIWCFLMEIKNTTGEVTYEFFTPNIFYNDTIIHICSL